MRRIHSILIILLCSFASLPNAALATNYIVGFYNYPPMMIEQDTGGIYQDVFDEISKLTGDTFSVRYYPYPRLGMLFNQGAVDIEPGVYPGWVQTQSLPGVFSVPFGKIDDVLVFASGKAFPVNTPDDLRGRTVGMVRGYAYPDLKPLVSSGQLDRRNALNETQLLKMLTAGRFDQIIINKAVVQFNVFKDDQYAQLEVGDVLNSYDVSMRVNPKHAAWLPVLNDAILTLKKTGVLQQIYAKFGVDI